MRHHNVNRKFGRERNQRKALLRSLAIALFKQERIETTEAKAKEIKKYAEKIITKAKKNDVATRRLIMSKLGSGGKYVLEKIFKIAERNLDRPGGYTRIIKKGDRIGTDGAPMAIIEFVK